MSVATDDSPGLQERYHFLLRRLHSLSGIIPVGVFLMVHLTINSTVLFSGDDFQQRVDMIHSLGGFLVPVEIVGIFLPIFFHAVLGVVILLTGKPNPMAYTYGGSWRYALQRWTGLIVFAFILVHLWHMHWLGERFGGAFFDPHQARATAAGAMQMNAIWVPVYVLGLLASVFHFANGLWTAAITWGLTIGNGAQRKWGYVSAAVGVVLSVTGLVTIGKLRAMDVPPLTEHGPAAHEVSASVVPGDEPVGAAH